MLILLDTSEKLEVCADELQCEVGQLLTPLTRFNLQNKNGKFAIDNGAFSKFEAKGFMSLLDREKERRQNCIFVAVPDVVGSARRTLEVFQRWKGIISAWPLALVAQDGQEDLEIPWDDIAAIFLGGSTKFKVSDEAAQIVKAAKALDKWVHAGRVNDPQRFKHFEEMGADSCDGSGISQYSHMRRAIANRHAQLELVESA